MPSSVLVIVLTFDVYKYSYISAYVATHNESDPVEPYVVYIPSIRALYYAGVNASEEPWLDHINQSPFVTASST